VTGGRHVVDGVVDASGDELAPEYASGDVPAGPEESERYSIAPHHTCPGAAGLRSEDAPSALHALTSRV